MGLEQGPFGAVISVDNVNEALPIGLDFLRQHGKPFTSRGRATLEAPGPVSTIYRNPARRVLFDTRRDANPFFHLMESLWILSGSRMAALPCAFLPTLAGYSDDGVSFHGAYGYRLRHAGPNGIDQLRVVAQLLADKPDTRQAVLSIWDPSLDLYATTKDMPCNDLVMFNIRDGRLHMTVCNRSNDVIWGAYGANVVQFSMLQEWLACALGCEVGYYTQVSNSFHVYPDTPFWAKFVHGEHDAGHVSNPYMDGKIAPCALAFSPEEAWAFLGDCEELAARAEKGHGMAHMAPRSGFFTHTVIPTIIAYQLYKKGMWQEAFDALNTVGATDWARACTSWISRRYLKKGAV